MNSEEKDIFSAYKSSLEDSKVINENKLDPVGKEDADINNDGKVDDQDRYIADKRKKISDEIAKRNQEQEEGRKKEENGLYHDALYIWDYLLNKKKYSPQNAMKILNLAKTSFEHTL